MQVYVLAKLIFLTYSCLRQSDKVWNLEEENANLERTLREMEEAAEIAAEMEEVQADELKIMMRDLEGRDALVKNLEEAIRM